LDFLGAASIRIEPKEAPFRLINLELLVLLNLMIKKMKLYDFLWYWLPTLAYCIVIFSLSSSKIAPIPSFFGVDKVIHGIEYTVLGLLLARSIISSKPKFSKETLILLIVTLGTLYGIFDEVHQSFVPGRSSSHWDVLADGFGSLIGVLFYLKISRRPRASGQR